ncbi:hypothetical protein PCI56_01335 [Plesiomonas shigelloides subsp. oncorhynchi]|nr:hypothetical protein [Plesiomonas shigelloides]
MATVAAGAPLVALAKKAIDYEASFAGVKRSSILRIKLTKTPPVAA